MIDLLRERLAQANRVIIQIERALSYFQLESASNRPGGCFCQSREGGYHNHTDYCERANLLMSSARWYLKKNDVKPSTLEQLQDMEIGALKAQLKAFRYHQHEKALSLGRTEYCKCGNEWPCTEV